MKWIFKNVLLVSVLSLAWESFAVDPGQYLTPTCTEENPYTFVNKKGQSVTLPSTTYPEWSIFNATSVAAEAATTMAVTSEDDTTHGSGMLKIQTQSADESAYLALKIQANDGTPWEMTGDNLTLNTHAISLTTSLVQCDAVPAIETLQEMYATYNDRLNSATVDGMTYVAAKTALCVMSDGYFYVARVRHSEDGNPANFIYEFVQTHHKYAEVGEGKIDLRFEFVTIPTQVNVTDNTLTINRGYRIFAKASGAAVTEEICLTDGIGYKWGQAKSGDEAYYKFDFTSFEADTKSQWLFAIDSCLMAAGKAIDWESLDTLSRVGFSASDGGLYQAWLTETKNAPLADALSTLSSFRSMATLDSPFLSQYMTWLSTKGAGASLATTDGATDENIYDEFLLNMTADANTQQTLTISELSTLVKDGQKVISVTIDAPAGVDLSKANARVCLRRAETLEALATAEPTYYTAAIQLVGNKATLVLPVVESDNTELPFMQATLVPLTETPQTSTLSAQ